MSSSSSVPAYRSATCVSLALTCLLMSAPALAQGAAAPPTERWQPRDGIYASPGKDFEADCNETHFIAIDLSEKSVSGNEWSCEINKRTNTAVDAIQLDMTCYDYNLAGTLYPKDPDPGARKLKETMLLKRLDNGAISVRKTANNKFSYPSWRANYCPEQVQQRYTDGKAEAQQKAAEDEMRRNPWYPKAGVYVTPGTNFAERCLSGGEVTIDLDERSLSAGADKCSVNQIRDELFTLQLLVECTTPKSAETIMLRKLDDKAILLQKTKDRKFSNAGELLVYCGPATQAMYAQKKSKK